MRLGWRSTTSSLTAPLFILTGTQAVPVHGEDREREPAAQKLAEATRVAVWALAADKGRPPDERFAASLVTTTPTTLFLDRQHLEPSVRFEV